MNKTKVAVGLILLGLSFLRSGTAAGDEIDYRIKAITAFSDGKTNDPAALSSVSTMSPDMRADLLKRAATSPPQVRALILFTLVMNGHVEETAPELDGILKRGAATGRLRVVSEVDLLRIASSYPDVQKEPLRSLAAGMYLAKNNVREDPGALSRYSVSLNSPEGETNTSTARREAVTYIGLLHLRRVTSDTSQRVLEKALQDNDGGVRANAAKYVGVTSNPRSVEALVNSLRKENQALNFQIKLWALSKAVAYPPEALWPQVPVLFAMMEDFDLTDEARQAASQALRIITTKEDRKSQEEWWSEKKKQVEEMKAAAARKGPVTPVPPDAPKTPPDRTSGTTEKPPVTPDDRKTPAPSPSADPDKEIKNWLLLAKNFMNQKNYEKAEEYLKRILDKAPDSKQAADAKELLKQVEAVKGL
jgi:tetratricopeptide (TPR) repeat protein